MRSLYLKPLLLLAAVLPGWALAHPGASSSIEYFSHQISHNPDWQSPYVQRGIAYSMDGRYDEALEDFQKARSLGNPLVVSFDLGVLFYRRGELELARSYFDEYLGAFPDDAACLEYRARLLRDSGDVVAAVADFKSLFEVIDRPNPGHYISAATLLASSETGGAEEALALLDDGMARIGLNSQLQKLAIELELDRDRYDLALSRQMTLQPQLGHAPDWKVETAHLYIQAGRPEQARVLLDEALVQLASLRPTPARLSLLERSHELKERSSPGALVEVSDPPGTAQKGYFP